MEHWLDWVAPPRCEVCASVLGAGGGVFCAGCRPSLYLSSRTLEGVPLLSAFNYKQEPVRDALHRFKFQDRPEMGRLLSRELAFALSSSTLHRLGAVNWLPVPSDPVRLIERRYNQAMLLARGLAVQSGGRVYPTLLERQTASHAQTHLTKRDRQTNVCINVSSRFAHGQQVASRRVVLVDDVCTTGATLRGCIEGLRASGMSVQAAVVFADNP